MSYGRVDARAISEQLAGRIDSLARQLLPAGHYASARRAWRCGSIQGEPGDALVVRLAGGGRGRWRDYKAGVSGDSLDLVAQVACNGDLRTGIAWARDWLGLGNVTRHEAEQLRQKAEISQKHRQQVAEREALRNRQDAKRLWLAAAPLVKGDLAWQYLFGRGIDLDLLPAPPAALRLHPGLYNAESRRYWPGGDPERKQHII